MPINENNQTLLRGLSDFWQRFFADSPQLESMYKGTGVLLGQAYLDLVTNVINTSILDSPLVSKQYWKLITIREDEVAFLDGPILTGDKWTFTLPDNIVEVNLLDNKIIEPTASLQSPQDFTVDASIAYFEEDPTDTDGTGTPLPGYAFRKVDIVPGGALTDSAVTDWLATDVKKGDTVRLIDDRLDKQVKISDHVISVVRTDAVYVSSDTPFLEETTGQDYVILRKPTDNIVTLEVLTFVNPLYNISAIEGVPFEDRHQVDPNAAITSTGREGYSHVNSSYTATATLSHSRIVEGSVKVYGKASNGEDVKEDIDYVIDYEGGILRKISVWASYSLNKIDYEWLEEIYPDVGPTPRLSTGDLTLPNSLRVTQIALWAPDVLIDKETLYTNFGSMIGVKAASTESYRSFLRGVFQLYMLGPTLERIESALNVILGFPVIRDDGEILTDFDNSDPVIQTVTTLRPNGQTVVYQYPIAIPIREDIQDPVNFNVLTFKAFEHVTEAASVTDYIQDPEWFYTTTIPAELFDESGVATIPSTSRRTITPLHYENVIGAVDNPQLGDPGLYIGADDEQTIPAAGHPILRHKMAFVLFDRYMKRHIFRVRFDNSIFVTEDVGVEFASTPDELKRLVFDAKPAYTYLLAVPQTFFEDTVIIEEEDVEVTPQVQLLNQLLYADTPPTIGGGWSIADYFHYEDTTENVVTVLSTPVVVTYSIGIPNRDYFAVRLWVNTTESVNSTQVVEGVDYTFDYDTNEITRLTNWNDNSPDIDFVVAVIGNDSIEAKDDVAGDTHYSISGNDPRKVRASYDPAAVDVAGNPWPVENHRDFSITDRAVFIRQIP